MGALVMYPRVQGPFPVIIFSHGYGSLAESYKPFLEQVTRAGYVVVGPDYPELQVAAHPAQLSSVIDWITAHPRNLPQELVDARHIGVMGHSLGGADVLGVTYNSCCRDTRIAAAITIEGIAFPFPGGTYSWHGAPLLMVLDTDDPLIPYNTGTQTLHSFKGSAYLLTISGGQHDGGMDPGAPGHQASLATIDRFLSAYLKGDGQALRKLRTAKYADAQITSQSG
jgi:predicted dienelactone hydrolase